MQTRRLSEAEFKPTMIPNMHNVTETATDVLDIWPYVGSVAGADLEGHSIYDRFVEYVYRSDDDCFDHVLVMTRTKKRLSCRGRYSGPRLDLWTSTARP